MKIVETDNYDRDDAEEKFLEPTPSLPKDVAQRIADMLNSFCSDDRYYKVVDDAYQLSKGFEP